MIAVQYSGVIDLASLSVIRRSIVQDDWHVRGGSRATTTMGCECAFPLRMQLDPVTRAGVRHTRHP